MTGKNFDLSLKVNAEFNQAQKNAQSFANTMDEIGESAKTAATQSQTLSEAVDKAGIKYVYAGRSAFSMRDSLVSADASSRQLANTTTATAAAVDKAARTFVYAGKSSFSFRDGLTSADASSTQLTNTVTAAAAATDKAARTFTYAGKSSFSFRDGLDTVRASSKEQAAELGRLLSTYDAISAASLKLAQDGARLKQAFDQGRISQEQYDRASANIARRNQALGASFNSLRGQMGNIGFQLQDIAVQAQMGVNPLIILSQQGSQLVSGFNPLAGAIIAVGGAIAGALLPSLFNAGDAAKDLEGKVKDLDESYKNLTETQRQFLRDQEGKKKAAILKDIEEQKESVRQLTNIYQGLKASQENAMGPRPGTFIGMSATGAGINASDEEVLEAEQKITQARTVLELKNKELAESEKELRRINGEKVLDEKELAKQATQTIERLKEETETYKLAGEALGKYVADKLNLQEGSTTRQEIIDLYKKQEAQKKLNETEREAEANEKRRKSEAESKKKASEDYVKSLERQAIALEKTDEQLRDYDNAERGLTNSLLARARAAQQVIATEKDKASLAELNIQLLRTQGKEQEATQQEFQKRYGDMLKRLEDAGNKSGVEIIKKIINLRALESGLNDIEKKFQSMLDNISRQENSIQVQREAGLLSEYEARQKIYELHQQQAEKLKELRPLFEELQGVEGEVGEAARAIIADIDAEVTRLQSTMTLLQSTLRDGLESGLTDAILGLADGTMTLRDAVQSLARSVAESLAQMAAQALAQKAVQALFNLGGKEDSGTNMKEGAQAATTAAGALVLASAQWRVTATQIQAAAAKLAASNSGGGGGGGGSSGGSWWSTAFQAVASYYAADGGHITGPGTSTSDSIPTMLSNNEYVTRAAVVEQPGALSFLHDFNRYGMRALNAWAPARHNTGGIAGVPAPAMPSPTMGTASLPERASSSSSTTLQNSQNFYLVDDPSRFTEYLKTPAGKESVLVMLKRDPGEFRSILNIQG